MNLQRSKGGEEGKGREGRKREGGREGKGGEREGAESRECVYVLCVILNIIADEQNKQPSKKTGEKKRDSNRPRPQPFLQGFAERRSHEDEKAVTREESYAEKSTVRQVVARERSEYGMRKSTSEWPLFLRFWDLRK